MTEQYSCTRTRCFVLEAVPTSNGQYQATFRIHLERALPRNDEVHFGGIFSHPLAALDEARVMARVYLSRHNDRI